MTLTGRERVRRTLEGRRGLRSEVPGRPEMLMFELGSVSGSGEQWFESVRIAFQG